ncbi:MAG TPA: S8 family serine peptidase [Longimicrobium sp.]|nr:S8 family serine peptidase [Longimicrobium sp.]
MIPSPTGLRMAALTLVFSSLLCTAACRDNPAEALARPPGAGARFVATVVCSVDVKARRSTCELVREAPAAAHGARLTIIRDAQAMVQTGSDAYTAADSTYRLNIRLVNTSGNALGTRDGSTVTGIKAFIPVNIMGYAGRPPGDTTRPSAFLIPPMPNINALVKARNPDGRMAFTAADQPFWNYPQKLEPGQSSQWREWAFTLHPSVSYFYFAVSVFAAVPGEQAVPTAIPANWGQPHRYFEPQYQINCSKIGIPRCVYDVVDVSFRASATQEERQAAIEAVGGTLEAGSRMTGRYYVRIIGDTALVALRRTVAALRSFPQVRWAYPHEMTSADFHYLRPSDGSNWTAWEVRDSAANGHTWALEAISGPLAWGCDTGGVAVPIAVIDSDIHNVADLGPNLDPTSFGVGQLHATADTIDHGTKTSGIIAARGNNGSGITGTMWSARLRVYEAVPWDSAKGAPYRRGVMNPVTGFMDSVTVLDIDTVLARVLRAATEGAGAINLSIGTNWIVRALENGWITSGNYDPATETNATRDSANKDYVQDRYDRFAAILDSLKSLQIRPLIVMSAGNDRIDASWDGFEKAALTYDNVLVVGAARNAGGGTLRPMQFSTGGTTFGTNYGPIVEIAAPGQDVYTLNRNGEVRVTGTSFAAPYVTGVAGLLLQFDPRLNQHPDSLKRLLIQGAVNGRRRIVNGPGPDSLPVLNAYEALKAAAQRRGAPLCGNRMWTESQRITVQRGSVLDTLVSFGGGISRDNVDVLHGGRAMRVDFTGQFGRDSTLSYTLQNGTWRQVGTAAGWAPAVAGSGGSYLSARRRSHNGDTLVTAYEGKVYGYSTLDLGLSWPGGSRAIPHQLRRASQADGLHSICVARTASSVVAGDTLSGCTSYYLLAFYSETPGWSVIYHPLGGKLIVASTVTRGSTTLNGWSGCPWPVTATTPASICRTASASTSSTAAEIRLVDIASATEQTLYTVDPGDLRRVTADESGRELMFLRTNAVQPSYFQPAAQYGEFQWVYPPYTPPCTAEVRSLATGVLKSTIPNINCQATDHGIFFTPVRTPASRP